jgi:tagatose 1,6-diphosphate aldolase
MPTRLTPGKLKHLRALSNSAGVIAAVAMDQRGSLMKIIAAARGMDRKDVPASMLSEFKTSVSRILSPHASAILLDPEYGLPATGVRGRNCGLLLAYEFSGYDNTRPGRLPDLLENVSVKRIKEWGADACKVLIYYSPFDAPRVNDIKHALIERVGSECAAEDIPFFLELLSYDPEGGDEKGLGYAKLKPRMAVGTIVEFCKPRYGVEVLKVEVPIVSKFTEGSRAFCGDKAYSYQEALGLLKEASDASTLPFIYLSAGVDNDVFTEQLRMAAEAGSDYSGVLCGRATWKGGLPVYGKHGPTALEEWLSGEGVANIGNVNEAIRPAKPWWMKLGLTATEAA